MLNLLSSLADNFSEGLYKDNCKDSKSDLDHVTAKENTQTFNREDCQKKL